MNLSSSMLKYRLLEGPVSLEPLRILESRRAEWRDWQVTFCVLGASHAVHLERNGLRLTELLACAMPEGAPRILTQREGAEPQSLCLTVPGLICMVHLAPFALEEGEQLRGKFPTGNRLDVAYPALPDSVTPYTRLGWFITAAELIVETVHTYPEEGRGVRSVSRFRLEAAR